MAYGRKNAGRIVFCAFAVWLLLLFAAPFTRAATPNFTVPCSLNLVMKTYSGAAVSGGKAAVYRVASWKPAGEGYTWEYTPDYALCGISADRLADSASAGALSRYTQKHGVAGIETTIGSDGTARFQDLAAGLYLIVQTTPPAGYYACVPFLLPLPYFSEPDGAYVYYVTAAPKLAPRHGNPQTPSNPAPQETEELPVLYADDAPFSETEDPPLPDAAESSLADMVFDAPAPEEPDLLARAAGAPDELSKNNGNAADRQNPSNGLPQTGQLWWPVPVLALAGLLMLLLARVMYRNADANRKES